MRRLTKVTIGKLNTFINVDIDFRPDVTLLYALNGCGKTSTLLLIENALSGKIREVATTNYSDFAIEGITNGDEPLVLVSKKTDEEICLWVKIGKQVEKWEETIDTGIHEEEDRLEASFRASGVWAVLDSITPPLMLGIDRRYDERERASFFYRQMRNRLAHGRKKNMAQRAPSQKDEGLMFAISIFENEMMRMRRKQSALDAEFREAFFKCAIEYASKQTQFKNISSIHTIDSSELEERRSHVFAAFERVQNGDLLDESLKKQINGLFVNADKADAVLKDLLGSKSKGDYNDVNKLLFILQMQDKMGFIESLSTIADDYEEQIKESRKSYEKFAGIINRFFAPSKKTIHLSENGELLIDHNGDPLSLWNLSSGERQMIILFVHLIFDASLAESGVFIVDEPELSLHVGWQDMLIDSMVEANPSLQLILATHSPNIVGSRIGNCVEVGGDNE